MYGAILLGMSVRHSIKNANIWRHEKFLFILHKPNIKRCNWCERTCTAFRVKKHQNLTKRTKRISGTLTPNRAKTLVMLRKVKHNTQKSNLR